MPKFLSDEASAVSRQMIAMDIHTNANHPLNNPVRTYVCLMDADRYARKMSLLVPEGCQVKLEQDARIRAVYEKGERIAQSDMRDFYVMSDEEYAASKILCSVTHVYF